MTIFVQKKKSGFTLIELLVVVAIIGLLSSIVLTGLDTARAKARDTKRISELKQLQSALHVYHASTGQYPPGATNGHYSSRPNDDPNPCGYTQYPGQGFDEVFAPLVSGGYMDTLPQDPLSNRCFEYSRQVGSGWTCDGGQISINDYEYVLQFFSEVSTFNLPSSDQGAWDYCLLGPRR